MADGKTVTQKSDVVDDSCRGPVRRLGGKNENSRTILTDGAFVDSASFSARV